MSLKSSVSMCEKQDASRRRLIKQERYSSASPVVQQGLELLRQKTDIEEAELGALQAFLEERRAGPFDDVRTARTSAEDMIDRKRAAHFSERVE